MIVGSPVAEIVGRETERGVPYGGDQLKGREAAAVLAQERAEQPADLHRHAPAGGGTADDPHRPFHLQSDRTRRTI